LHSEGDSGGKVTPATAELIAHNEVLVAFDRHDSGTTLCDRGTEVESPDHDEDEQPEETLAPEAGGEWGSLTRN
jgi:hypothetical protein